MTKIITPVGRVLVKEIEEERKSAGGIIIAGESDPENKSKLGEVIFNNILVGSHPNRDYAVGNKVYFGKFAGATVYHEGVKYISLQEIEILAISK